MARKKNAAGAIAVIRADEKQKRPTTNLADQLDGINRAIKKHLQDFI
jgi:2-phospho-L-lactate guanylyltransferase (CobY/MobA/RfbA family)